MWAIRNGRTGKFLESTSLQLENIQLVARLCSQRIPHRFEIIELETMQITYVYANGQEFISTSGATSFNPVQMSDKAAEALGKQIWEDLVLRQQALNRLLRKLTISPHEEKQFALTQDKVAERESDLSMILTDPEYQCAHYTFVDVLSRRSELVKPNYCDRQIRRYTKKALIKTGQTAFNEQWKPIRLVPKNTEYSVGEPRSERPEAEQS